MRRRRSLPLFSLLVASPHLLCADAFFLAPPSRLSLPSPCTTTCYASTTTATTFTPPPPPTAALLEQKAKEEEEERQLIGQLKEKLNEYRHLHVTFQADSQAFQRDRGTFTDCLIEVGALEVSYQPPPASASASQEIMLEMTLPADLDLDQVMQLAATMQTAAIRETNEGPVELPPLPSYEQEEVDFLNGVNWLRASQEPGFAPVQAGRFRIVSAQGFDGEDENSSSSSSGSSSEEIHPMDEQNKVHELRILPGEGWGDGQHPTTRLCLDFLSQEGVICGAERVIDYGCGSGILSIGAIQLGAREAVGIDIDYEALTNARTNAQLNGVEHEIDLLHPREVVPGDFVPGDIVIANILVGTLLNMRNTIIGAVKPGGWLVLSGLRPEQVEIIKEKYSTNVKWEDKLERREEVVNPTWGTGAGTWVRLVGTRVEAEGSRWVEALSEAAVS